MWCNITSIFQWHTCQTAGSRPHVALQRLHSKSANWFIRRPPCFCTTKVGASEEFGAAKNGQKHPNSTIEAQNEEILFWLEEGSPRRSRVLRLLTSWMFLKVPLSHRKRSFSCIFNRLVLLVPQMLVLGGRSGFLNGPDFWPEILGGTNFKLNLGRQAKGSQNGVENKKEESQKGQKKQEKGIQNPLERK